MLPHATQLHYKNTRGWSINYVNAEAEGYRAQGGKNTEWLLVDPLLVDRFATEGQSYLPGAGKKWVHVHRPPHCGPQGFRTGDRVRMRQGVAEYWELDARALVTVVTPADKEVRPPSTRRLPEGATRAVLIQKKIKERHPATTGVA